MIDHKGRRGRPRKLVLDEGDLTIEVHTAISKKVYDLVPKDVRWKDLLEHAILAMYGSKEESDLRNLEEKLEKLELESAKIRLAISEKKAEQEKLRSLDRAMRIQERMPVVALRLLVQDMRRLTPNERQLSDPDGIARVRHLA